MKYIKKEGKLAPLYGRIGHGRGMLFGVAAHILCDVSFYIGDSGFSLRTSDLQKASHVLRPIKINGIHLLSLT